MKVKCKEGVELEMVTKVRGAYLPLMTYEVVQQVLAFLSGDSR